MSFQVVGDLLPGARGADVEQSAGQVRVGMAGIVHGGPGPTSTRQSSVSGGARAAAAFAEYAMQFGRSIRMLS